MNTLALIAIYIHICIHIFIHSILTYIMVYMYIYISYIPIEVSTYIHIYIYIMYISVSICMYISHRQPCLATPPWLLLRHATANRPLAFAGGSLECLVPAHLDRVQGAGQKEVLPGPQISGDPNRKK